MQRRTFLELAALEALRHAVPTPGPLRSERLCGTGRLWLRPFRPLDPGQIRSSRLPLHLRSDTRSKAFQPVNEAWRSSTDHIHQFGNDRVVAVASNYGYVQLRQDEGSPKFLNDYAPAEHRFGGGIGYLVDNTLVAGTHYPSSAARSFERTFGTGYFCKRLRAGHYEIEQVIFAPFGDDPVLVSQVTISNRSLAPATPRWIEYWGCQPYQFSYRSLMEGSVVTNADATPQLRRDFSRRFELHFESTPRSSGLLVQHHFLGRSAEEEALWQKMQDSLQKDPHGYFGGPVPPLAPGAEHGRPRHRPPPFSSRSMAPSTHSAQTRPPFFAAAPQIRLEPMQRLTTPSTQKAESPHSYSSAVSNSLRTKAGRSLSFTATCLQDSLWNLSWRSTA